jgi:DNA polymerase III delta prime subunit
MSDVLYIDKYVPSYIDKLIYGSDVLDKLRLLKDDDNNHLIISGNYGCGKKTFARMFIECKYDRVITVKSQMYKLKHKSKTDSLNINFKYSKFHYQINPSINGVYDRYIIYEFIMDIIKIYPISGNQYHIIVVEDADKLTMDSQQCLRRTLETFIKLCRFIFITNSHTINRCTK